MFVAPTKLVPNCVVGLCFEMKIEGCAVHRVLCGTGMCECKPKGTEEALICYSIYMSVQTALVGTPKSVVNSKCENVVCGAHDGMFFINWTVKGTVTNIRKSLNIALAAIKPAKLNSTYVELSKNIKGVKRDTFGYAADLAAKSLKSKLYIGVVGNTKMDKDQLADVLDVIIKKYDIESVSAPKNKPEDYTECNCHENSTEIKIKGWESAVLADYLEFKIKGLQVSICDNYILVPVKESIFDNKKSSLKQQSGPFLQTKYMKGKELLKTEWAYSAMSNGKLNCVDAKSGMKSMTMANLKAAIKL